MHGLAVVTESFHREAFRHPNRLCALSPGIAIRMQGDSPYSETDAALLEFSGAV